MLSNDVVLEKLESSGNWMKPLCVCGTAVSFVLYYRFAYYGDLWVNFIGWVSILALLITGRQVLNQRTGFTDYFNHASYPVYILHQSVLVALAYYMVQISSLLPVQILGTGIGSFLLTVLAYHVGKRIPGVRRMIGITS